DRRLEEVRTHELAIQARAARGEQGLDVGVAPVRGSGGDRLHAGGAQASRAEAAQQRGAEQRLADAGIGSGDEESRLHSSASSSAAVRSTRSSISPGSMT